MNEKDLILQNILLEAANSEEDSWNFYLTVSKKINAPHLKEFLQDLAKQELEHKNKLEKLSQLKDEEILRINENEAIDLMLAEQIKTLTIDANSTFQDILIVAMKKEKNSYDFYNHLSQQIKNAEIKKTLRLIAKEELIHKQKIETQYDDYVFKEN